jgi:hypothetical protein
LDPAWVKVIDTPVPGMVQVLLMSAQFEMLAETGAGGVGKGSTSGGGWYTGELVTGAIAGSMVTVPKTCQGPAYPEP